MKAKPSSKSLAEIAKFENVAEEWWNPIGKFKPLHDITPLRIEYILQQLKRDDFKSIKVIDIGCGGGIVSESFARLGMQVTAIDASEVNVNIAREHSKKQNLKIDYQCKLAEQIKGKKYDLVLALEIIEHVQDLEYFLNSCCNLVDEAGLLILSTMNRTIRSFLESICAAEYVLQWVPKGTHDWGKFIKPAELAFIIEKQGLKLLDIKGMKYSILKDQWYLDSGIDNNYFITFQKI